MGIAPSPIQTPKYDALGQLRVDDPQVAPPPGLGENVFKDRGAIDRADFAGPGAKLVQPLDNGGDDQDPSPTFVNLVRSSLDEFSIQLDDSQAPLYGSGIDDGSVRPNSVRVMQDDRELTPGEDYTVWYDSTNNILHIVPLAGVWDLDSNYVIQLQNQDQFVIQARSGDQIPDGDSFRIEDAYGNSFTFEYDTGYVVSVPETYAIQVPLQGGAAGGVGDGDTVTVGRTVAGVTTTVTIEFDNNGVVASANNLVVKFTELSTQGEVADALVKALKDAGLGLSPANVGGGLVHLGVDGTQTPTVTSATLTLQGVADGRAGRRDVHHRRRHQSRHVRVEHRRPSGDGAGAGPLCHVPDQQADCRRDRGGCQQPALGPACQVPGRWPRPAGRRHQPSGRCVCCPI